MYLIIPPILIIISLIGIILFLMKKAPLAAELEDDIYADEAEEKEGFLKNFSARVKDVDTEGIKHSMLVVLEKIARKSRMLFLKMEAKLGGISNNIRTRRQEIANGIAQEDKENDIIKKLKDYKPSKKPKYEANAGESFFEDKEKVIRPMISERVVAPTKKAEMKDRLEDLLIERIAVNPKDLEAYERLGEYYMEIRNYGDAKECFKQVLKLDSTNRNVKYKIRRLETLMNK